MVSQCHICHELGPGVVDPCTLWLVSGGQAGDCFENLAASGSVHMTATYLGTVTGVDERDSGRHLRIQCGRNSCGQDSSYLDVLPPLSRQNLCGQDTLARRHAVYERDFGNGKRVITFVTWAALHCEVQGYARPEAVVTYSTPKRLRSNQAPVCADPGHSAKCSFLQRIWRSAHGSWWVLRQSRSEGCSLDSGLDRGSG